MIPRNAFLKEMGKSGFYDFNKEPFSFRTKVCYSSRPLYLNKLGISVCESRIPRLAG